MSLSVDPASKKATIRPPLYTYTTSSTLNSIPVTPCQVHPEWTSGDFKLVSNDHWVFLVPIYLLQTWSETFRDTLETGTGKMEVQLDETAQTLHYFLWFITKVELFDVPDAETLLNLGLFLNKYNCPLAYKLYTDKIRAIIDNGDALALAPYQLFQLGAGLRNASFCCRAIQQSRRAAHCPKPRPEHLYHECTVSPHCFPKRAGMSLPKAYLWALALADVPEITIDWDPEHDDEDDARPMTKRSYRRTLLQMAGWNFLKALKETDALDE